MRPRRLLPLAAVSLLSLVCLAAPAAAGDEPVSLRWKFKAGDVAYVVQEQDMSTTTNAGPGPAQKQATKARGVLELKTESVDADGTGVVLLRFLSMDQTMEQPMSTMKVHVERKEGGEVVAKVDASGPSAQSTTPMMEQMMKGIFSVSVRAKVKATGEVVTSKVEGDAFAGLDAGEDPVAKAAIPMLKSLLDPEELFAQTIGALYLRVPAEPVKVGGTWEVSTATTAMGMKITAKGTAKLVSVEGAGGARVAKIDEDLTTEIDAAGFSEKMRKAMSAMGQGVEIDMSLTAEPTKTAQSVDFDVTAGRVIEVRAPDMNWKMSGAMTIKMGGTQTSTPMTMAVTGKTTTRFQSEKPK